MDPAQELTDAQVAVLRSRLETLRSDLEARRVAGADRARPVELDQTAVGRVSRIDALQSQAIAQATRESMELRLAQCESALRALERGDYGLCRRCEEPVGLQRLTARPEAPFCLECQHRLDQR